MSDKVKYNRTVEVNELYCKGCGYCEYVCPRGVFARADRLNTSGYIYMVTDNSKGCIGCLKCMMICPDFAVAIEEVPQDG